MSQKFPDKKTTKSKEGQAENRGSGQAGRVETGRIRYDRQDDGKKTTIQQETRERVAQYIGGKTGVRHGNRCMT